MLETVWCESVGTRVKMQDKHHNSFTATTALALKARAAVKEVNFPEREILRKISPLKN